MGLGPFVVLKWVQDWQFGLKLKASILTFDDLSGSKPNKNWFKARKFISTRKLSFGGILFYQKITFGPIWGTLNWPCGIYLGPNPDPYGAHGGRRPTKWGSGGEAPRKMGPFGALLGTPVWKILTNLVQIQRMFEERTSCLCSIVNRTEPDER